MEPLNARVRRLIEEFSSEVEDEVRSDITRYTNMILVIAEMVRDFTNKEDADAMDALDTVENIRLYLVQQGVLQEVTHGTK